MSESIQNLRRAIVDCFVAGMDEEAILQVWFAVDSWANADYLCMAMKTRSTENDGGYYQ